LPPGITKAQAQELETKLRRDLFDGAALGRRDEITLPGAIGLWLQSNRRKNQRQAASEARQWEPFVRGRMLREAPEVARSALTTWRAGKTTGASPATINRRLALLKAVCKAAWRQGLISENLSGRIPLLREDNKREVYLTRAQVQALARTATSTTVRSAILLLAYTGLRAGELLALPKQPRNASSISIAHSKTGKPRIVPVPPVARPLLSRLPLGLSYWQLRRGFDDAKVKAGLPHVRLHDLRHSCASMLINAGVDLYVVGKILGHSGPQTTARYAHLATATLDRAMRKLK
jgi:integrase